MVAESIPERRPVLPTSSATRPARVRTALAAVLIGIVTAASAVLIPSSAQAAAPLPTHNASSVKTAASALDDSVSVQLSPTNSVVLHPGEDLRVTATVTNHTASAIPSAVINVYLAERALTSRSAIDAWLNPDATTGTPGDLLQSHQLGAEVQPGHSTSVDLTIPAAEVGLTADNAWGARGIAATLTTGKGVQADGRSTFVWYSGEPITPVTLTTVFPITVPAGSADASGLIPAETLTALTGPGGQLSRELDAVANRPITLAIDPMIIASIRILGNSAPAEAVDWLNHLSQVSNDTFPLSYADADIALQAQAGAATLLAPLSFDQDIDPALFTTPPATGDSQGGSPAVPAPGEQTPTPTPTPGAVIPPTTAEILDFDYTTTDVGWPSAGVVSSADLAVFAASGLGSTILSGANVTNSDSSVTPNAVLALDHTVGLTTDDALQSALRAAVIAPNADAWRGAMARASALLAVVAAERSTSAHTLLATFDRASTEPTPFLTQTLEVLGTAPWQTPGNLQSARAGAPTEGVAFSSESEPDRILDPAVRLLTRETELTAFSNALASPLEVTGTQRLELLSLFAVAWEPQSVAWMNAVTTSLAASTKILDSVVVTTKGPINALSSKVEVPVTLTNALDQAVTVRVNVAPSNGRLVVGSDEVTTIEANSARVVKIPVTARVGNGEVTLRVTLFTPAGTPVGEPGMIAVNVKADWEILGTGIFAALVVLFFGFGVWRNIARRRKARNAPPAADAAGTAGTDGESSSESGDAPSSESDSDAEPTKTVTEPGDDTRE
jgi:hypothetical protein